MERETVLDAALDLANEVGSVEFNVTELSHRLGISTTEIGREFLSLGGLRRAVAEHACRDFPVPSLAFDIANWREGLRDSAYQMRLRLQLNSALVEVVGARGGPDWVTCPRWKRELEATSSALENAGLTCSGSAEVVAALERHVFGWVAVERLKHVNSRYPGLRESEGSDADWESADRRVASLIVGGVNERAFEFGLDCILEHVASLIDADAI
ncbi:hypothetical protein [Mycobacterium sp. 236(2023)]|uniref:hypothetical protein n=1 Tax=Mycobacterium sp. 236(2023) TaxID=3038163 RepID=UPI00241554A8|nr:hypothetical protein [Mycobacterium sp. 236(2023)]MDG4667898.1 hypothetical protein [Mycobacterium sp. 236(2023)]